MEDGVRGPVGLHVQPPAAVERGRDPDPATALNLHMVVVAVLVPLLIPRPATQTLVQVCGLSYIIAFKK